MIDPQSLAELAFESNGNGVTSIMSGKAASGAIKELAFCHRDRCFFVKVGGRERLRSDSLDMVLPFYNGASTE